MPRMTSGHPEHRLEVGVEHVVPLGILHPHSEVIPGDPGIIDEDRYSTETFRYRRGPPRKPPRRSRREPGHAWRSRRRRGRPGCRLRPCPDVAVPTTSRPQPPFSPRAIGATDATGSAGDQRHLTRCVNLAHAASVDLRISSRLAASAIAAPRRLPSMRVGHAGWHLARAALRTHGWHQRRRSLTVSIQRTWRRAALPHQGVLDARAPDRSLSGPPPSTLPTTGIRRGYAHLRFRPDRRFSQPLGGFGFTRAQWKRARSPAAYSRLAPRALGQRPSPASTAARAPAMTI